jgi:methylenetetrahydrofolate dehydrogenase (NADP+) / methenyltetrahydrofolate cyclohydrolase
MVSLEKDVDGFHPVNIGRLSMKGREPLFVPCTPAGCVELLVRSGVEIRGKEAVVLGRSNIVGLPVAMLLLHRDATITICHSRTRDLPATCRQADILIAAVGRAEMVKGIGSSRGRRSSTWASTRSGGITRLIGNIRAP